MKEETIKQWDFFLQIWKELPEEKKCQSCSRRIYGPPKPLYFDHLLEKSKYPELRYEKSNIFIVCGDCHHKKNMGYPTPKHQEAINKAIKQLLNQEHD